jgi:RNA polymerase sigma-70 factor, ECF subfamily
VSALIGHGNARPLPCLDPVDRTRELYEKYGQRVFTFCYRRLGNREEAQDAAQTTFIYVMRSLERGVVPEFELAWILKIAFNVCRGTQRSAPHRMAANRDLAEVDDLPDLSNPGVESNERLEALREGLQALPETQRRAILLREWQGLTYAEIADELGLTVGAVETLLFRARRNLTRRLAHARGIFSALNLGMGVLALRGILCGVRAKLALIGAATTVALVPVATIRTRPVSESKSAAPVRPSLPAAPRASDRVQEPVAPASPQLAAAGELTAMPKLPVKLPTLTLPSAVQLPVTALP